MWLNLKTSPTMMFFLAWLPILDVLCVSTNSFIQEDKQSAYSHEKIQETLQNACSVILSGKGEPVYVIHYPDTTKNRLFLAFEISRLYGAFLTIEMHEENLCAILQQKGMWIQKRSLYHPVPTSFQISLFISTLERELLQSLEKTKSCAAWVHLGYDYGPTSAILELVFREVGLDADFYYLLPYKSHTYIYIHDGEIILNLNFKGPPI